MLEKLYQNLIQQWPRNDREMLGGVTDITLTMPDKDRVGDLDRIGDRHFQVVDPPRVAIPTTYHSRDLAL